jgi:hypothetical protein
MSAATMLACGADEIVMGKHSALGPVDPQFIMKDAAGQTSAVPAQAILDQFEMAREECKDPALLGAWVPMLGQYGPALLKQCENALQLAEDLVTEWLGKWMLAGEKYAKRRARRAAKQLRDHTTFKSHGRHITRDRAAGMGLRVVDLEKDQQLQDLVLSVFHATTLTFDQTPCVKIIENHMGKAFVKLQRVMQIPAQFVLPGPPKPAPGSPPPGAAGPTTPPA